MAFFFARFFKYHWRNVRAGTFGTSRWRPHGFNRLYIIDRQGRVAYKAGRGPGGFKPEEMEQSLLLLLLGEQLAAKRPVKKGTP